MDVPPLDEDTDSLLWNSQMGLPTPKIAVDNGNKSNYLVGEDVIISVFSDEPDTIELIRNGEVIENITVNGKAFFVRTPPRGYYVARLKNKGDSVEFCVNQAKTRYEIHNGMITVYADPCDEKSVIHYMDFRQKGVCVAALEKYEELSSEEMESGKITRPIPPDFCRKKRLFLPDGIVFCVICVII